MSGPNSPIDDLSLEAQIKEARTKAALFSKSLQEARDQEARALKTLEDERLRWTQSFEEKSILIDQLEQELTSTVDALDEERKTARSAFHYSENVHEQNDRIRTSQSFDRDSHYVQNTHHSGNRYSDVRTSNDSNNNRQSNVNIQPPDSRPHTTGHHHKVPTDYRDIDRISSPPRMERVSLQPPHKQDNTLQHEKSSHHYISSDMDKDYEHIHRSYKELKSHSPQHNHHQNQSPLSHHLQKASSQSTDSPPSPDNNFLWKELYTQCNLQLNETRQLLTSALSEFEQVKLDLLKVK